MPASVGMGVSFADANDTGFSVAPQRKKGYVPAPEG
jgi:hypothetical protein